MSKKIPSGPGLIVLFGSGETSPSGRKIFEEVIRSLPPAPKTVLLETPAGFEPNSSQVIGRVKDFLLHRLQNFNLDIEIVPARKRGTSFSPDNTAIVAPLLGADLIFMGPGSPSYAIRQLSDSLAWHYLVARHRLGAALVLASAAAVAISSWALPVYEIYKVGEDVHWIKGLDFFQRYGLELVFVPHWNNHEGGAELDTSRCFMGQERFLRLLELLPPGMTIVGLDEKTALMMDPSGGECQVRGLGQVTLLHTGHKHRDETTENTLLSSPTISQGMDEDLSEIIYRHGGHVHVYQEGQAFPLGDLGPFHPFHSEDSLSESMLLQTLDLHLELTPCEEVEPPEDVKILMQEREKLRLKRDWSSADHLRKQANSLGWEVIDTREGPVVRKITS